MEIQADGDEMNEEIFLFDLQLQIGEYNYLIPGDSHNFQFSLKDTIDLLDDDVIGNLTVNATETAATVDFSFNGDTATTTFENGVAKISLGEIFGTDGNFTVGDLKNLLAINGDLQISFNLKGQNGEEVPYHLSFIDSHFYQYIKFKDPNLETGR